MRKVVHECSVHYFGDANRRPLGRVGCEDDGMTGQTPSSAPDGTQSVRNAVGKLLGFLLVQGALAGGVNLFFGEQWFWVGLAGSLVVAGAAWLTLPGGPFAKDSRPISSAQRVSAALMLVAYLAASVYAASNATVVSAVLTTACFAAASTMLLWPTLRVTVSPSQALFGVAMLLSGMTGLLLGVGLLVDAGSLSGLVFLLLGLAGLLLGVAALLLAVGTLVDRWLLKVVAALLFGVAALMVGVANLMHGWLLLGVVYLLLGVTGPLLAVASRIGTWLTGVGSLLLGLVALLIGAGLLVEGVILMAIASLLLGAAGLFTGVALLTDWKHLRGRIVSIVSTFFRREHVPPSD